MITERAAGNPFFAEEMVRDLASATCCDNRGAYADGGPWRGQRACHVAGDYRCAHRPT